MGAFYSFSFIYDFSFLTDFENKKLSFKIQLFLKAKNLGNKETAPLFNAVRTTSHYLSLTHALTQSALAPSVSAIALCNYARSHSPQPHTDAAGVENRTASFSDGPAEGRTRSAIWHCGGRVHSQIKTNSSWGPRGIFDRVRKCVCFGLAGGALGK